MVQTPAAMVVMQPQCTVEGADIVMQSSGVQYVCLVGYQRQPLCEP